MGDHTDYNHGFVLPIAIPLFTRVVLTHREDDRVHVTTDLVTQESAEFTLGQETRRQSWIDYVQGLTHVLRLAGHSLRGFDLQVTSELPIGAGLSSSAALEVAILRGLRTAFALPLSDLDIARLGRAVETDFIGVPIGIMDQMICSLGDANAGLFIDTRTLATDAFSLPDAYELVVIDSGISHAHGTGGYRTRREECARAAEQLGVSSLRDCSTRQLDEARTLDPTLRRRVRHVLSENERVHATLTALRQQNEPDLGRLFAESQASLRDDYEVSVPEIDRLVELARTARGIIAARMTGGGFGGAVVMLAHRGAGAAAAQQIIADANPAAALVLPRL